MPALKAYTAGLPYSYAAGVYPSLTLMETAPGLEIGRASCRERVCNDV